MSTPYCLTFGHAATGATCHECGANLGPGSPFVAVGLRDIGRLCQDCGRATPFGYLAEALDELDTAVKSARNAREQGAMALNVQLAVESLVEKEWMPLAISGMTPAGDAA